MKTEHADYAVVGYSLAGVAAALMLAQSGHRVVLLDFHRDTESIPDLVFIQSTSLGPRESGIAFDKRIREMLRIAGVARQTNCFVASVYSEEKAIVACSDRRWSCGGVIFAPNGTEPGLNGEESSALQGFGVSYAAVADAPFYMSHRVAVFGDSPRVVDQAWIASQYASEVIVLVKEKHVGGDSEVLRQLRSSRAVAFERAVRIRALHAATNGTLSSIEIESPTGMKSIHVSALFVAQHLVPIVDIVRDEANTGRIVLAGLATKVDYWKHSELVKDGERAARKLLMDL